MRKVLGSMIVFGVLGLGSMQASVQNLANMSDIKEVIQLLLRAKHNMEDQILKIQGQLETIISKEPANAKRDASIAELREQIEQIKNGIETLQAAIKEIDPNNIALKNANGENFLVQTFATQKEVEEFKKLIFDELGKLKDHKNGAGQDKFSISPAVLGDYERRLKKLEKEMQNCGCSGIPEHEIK